MSPVPFSASHTTLWVRQCPDIASSYFAGIIEQYAQPRPFSDVTNGLSEINRLSNVEFVLHQAIVFGNVKRVRATRQLRVERAKPGRPQYVLYGKSWCNVYEEIEASNAIIVCIRQEGEPRPAWRRKYKVLAEDNGGLAVVAALYDFHPHAFREIRVGNVTWVP